MVYVLKGVGMPDIALKWVGMPGIALEGVGIPEILDCKGVLKG